MTKRVFLPLLCFGLLTVAAIVLLSGSALAQARTQEVQLHRAAAISHIAERARPAVQQGQLDQLTQYLERFYDTYGEAVLVVDATGEPVTSVGDISLAGEAKVITLAALRGVPQWSLRTVVPWERGIAYMAEPLRADEENATGAVLLAVNETAAQADVLRSWLLIGTAGFALLALLLAAAAYWTRWVLRPVQALDAATHALTEHRDLTPLTESGPPELRNLSHSFAQMVHSVNAALDQQRGLVADASHQLRNPLAAIRLRIDGLRAETDPHTTPHAAPRTPVGTATELNAVEQDLDRLEHTVNRMLRLASAEHQANVRGNTPGSRRQRTAPAAERVSAHSLVAPHLPMLNEAGITVIASADEHLVNCRPEDLAEILEILMDNAHKYVAAGAKVWVTIRSCPGTVILDVTDSGLGMTAEELTHVGQRFWRSRQQQHQPGSGLGYAIIAQLVRANDGSYTVGRAPGGGLHTQVRLPSE